MLKVDRLRFAAQHAHPGDDEKSPEKIKDKMKLRDELDAQPDHGCAHQERAHDPPDQDPVLVARRHPEVGEDETEDEDVVDTERVLDEVAGKKINRLIGALPPPDKGVEAQRESNPEKAAPDRAAQADSFVRPVAKKIDGQRGENSSVKRDPKPDADRHEALGFHE